jgi:hypothetical protein
MIACMPLPDRYSASMGRQNNVKYCKFNPWSKAQIIVNVYYFVEKHQSL